MLPSKAAFVGWGEQGWPRVPEVWSGASRCRVVLGNAHLQKIKDRGFVAHKSETDLQFHTLVTEPRPHSLHRCCWCQRRITVASPGKELKAAHPSRRNSQPFVQCNDVE